MDPPPALTALFPEGVLDAQRLPGHSPSPSWRVRGPQGAAAVKLMDAPSAQGLAALLTLLRSAGLPVPAAQARVGPTGAGLVTAWLPGVTLAAALHRDPGRAADLGARLGAVHARLHAWTPPAAVLRDLPAVEDAPGRALAVVHLDLHPLNVLVHSGEVSALLDWENVRLGDPRLDVARTLSILSVDPGVRALPPEARSAVQTLRRAYLEAYRTASGLSLDDLPAFLAWAGAFLQHDLAGRASAAQLAPARRWTRAWAERPSARGV